MLDPREEPYHKPLEGGLALRTVVTAEDLERVAKINDVVHEPVVGEMSRKIFLRHPNITGRDVVFIENEQGEAIATLCLIPWTLRLGDVDLPAAELGIVGTLEAYRGRGLNRVMMDYYWQRFAERGALLSIIQGIPYFYRQYGYEYALMPLEGGLRLQPDQVPQQVPGPIGAGGWSLRAATVADIPLLERLYAGWTGLLGMSARRGEAVWQYLLEPTATPEAMQHATQMVLDPGGEPVGYLRIPDYHFNENLLTLDEVSDLPFPALLWVLDALKGLARERGKDGIRLYLPASSGMARLVKSLGAASLGDYSWQVCIPDRAAFLRRIAPVLEKRLAGSIFAGWTGSLGLNLYSERIWLGWKEGRLETVTTGKGAGDTILNIPPTQFVPLVMGGRTLDEINAAFPDAHANSPWGVLVDTLFPRVSSYLATQY